MLTIAVKTDYRQMKQYKNLSNKKTLILLGALAANFLIYIGGHIIAKEFKHYDLSVSLDFQIPFLPWTSIIYVGCYMFWIINYYICVKYDKGNGFQFINSHFLGEIICFFFFVFFPTTTVRPEVLGKSISEQVVRFIYLNDAADNLFPSIHCFVSWLCWIGVRNNEHIQKSYQYFSMVVAGLVCISTLTVKQHVIADVPAGIILAELSYALSGTLSNNHRTHIY